MSTSLSTPSPTARASSTRLVDTPEPAALLLHPLRLRIVQELREPDSAAGVARRMRVPRQRLHHHLVLLERAGLVRQRETRVRGNCMERVLETCAERIVLDPGLLGALSPPPAGGAAEGRAVERLTRAVQEACALRRAAAERGMTVPDFSLRDTVRFRRAADRKAFLAELQEQVDRLCRKYDEPEAPGARPHQLTLVVQPELSGAAGERLQPPGVREGTAGTP